MNPIINRTVLQSGRGDMCYAVVGGHAVDALDGTGQHISAVIPPCSFFFSDII